MSTDKKPWEIEDPRKAPGVKPYSTNDALAERDYSIACLVLSGNQIVVIAGYWLWWCSSHHQPYDCCLKDKSVTNAVRKERHSLITKLEGMIKPINNLKFIGSEGDQIEEQRKMGYNQCIEEQLKALIEEDKKV